MNCQKWEQQRPHSCRTEWTLVACDTAKIIHRIKRKSCVRGGLQSVLQRKEWEWAGRNRKPILTFASWMCRKLNRQLMWAGDCVACLTEFNVQFWPRVFSNHVIVIQMYLLLVLRICCIHQISLLTQLSFPELWCQVVFNSGFLSLIHKAHSTACTQLPLTLPLFPTETRTELHTETLLILPGLITVLPAAWGYGRHTPQIF